MKRFKISNFDIGMPAILAGAGILTLIICLIVLIPDKEPSSENAVVSAVPIGVVTQMENRITELENRLNTLPPAPDTNGQSTDVLSENTVQLQSLSDQVSAIQKKIDYIDKRQGNLEQRVVALSTSAPTVKADTPARTPKPASKKENASKQASKPAVKKQESTSKQPDAASAKYHVVAAGDTRYSIARRYGLTVAQLDRLNGFSAATVIQPGQKILVQK